MKPSFNEDEIFLNNDEEEYVENRFVPEHHHDKPYPPSKPYRPKPAHHADPIPPKPPTPIMPGPDNIIPIPNPVPHAYYNPNLPRKPIEWQEDGKYVTKHDLNIILRDIADQTIYQDYHTNGTKVSVGGIHKGSRLGTMNFTQFVDYLLYPKSDVADTSYVTFGDLKDALRHSGGDYLYPAKKLSDTVENDIGGFNAGDSLDGYTIAEIIERLLCNSESRIFGPTHCIWKTDEYDLTSGDIAIDAKAWAPKLVLDMKDCYSKEDVKRKISSGKYELHVVHTVADSDNEDAEYWYDKIIAAYGSDQETCDLYPDINPESYWYYDIAKKQIVLSDAITTDMTLVLLKRN